MNNLINFLTENIFKISFFRLHHSQISALWMFLKYFCYSFVSASKTIAYLELNAETWPIFFPQKFGTQRQLVLNSRSVHERANLDDNRLSGNLQRMNFSKFCYTHLSNNAITNLHAFPFVRQHLDKFSCKIEHSKSPFLSHP